MIIMKKELKNLEEGKEEFLTDCKIRNLSENTIHNYDECFGYFLDFINNKFGKINIRQDMKKEIVDQYIIQMKDNGIKDTTINIRIRAIRCVLYYFMRNNYIEDFKIYEIKETSQGIELYTDDEIKKLLKKPNIKQCTFAEYRTWAIINFFIATGVRSRSLRNVRIEDLDFDNELIYIRVTKNRKLVIVPMGQAIKKVLLEYLRIRGGEAEDFLFCNLEGEQLTKNALNNLITKYNHKRGVMTTRIHSFRHYFAKQYIQNGGNVFKLQKILGHSSIQETQRYVDLFGSDLQVGFNEVSPLDNICSYKERIKMKVG